LSRGEQKTEKLGHHFCFPTSEKFTTKQTNYIVEFEPTKQKKEETQNRGERQERHKSKETFRTKKKDFCHVSSAPLLTYNKRRTATTALNNRTAE